MKFAICNETFNKGQSFAEVCRSISACGYEGIEIAPFTLAENIKDVSAAKRQEIRQTALDHGLEIVGLHWCLVSPKGLHINCVDKSTVDFTKDYYKELIRLCAMLGGKVMVHGSPKQRNWEPGEPYYEVFNRSVDFFRSCMDVAEEHGVSILIEPLTHAETNFIHRAQDGMDLIRAVSHPNFQLHLDVKAMCGSEYEEPATVIRQYKRP